MADSPRLSRRRPAFHRALLAWYRVNHRRLPWRTTPSLYRTVVSEFMLQQTQVTTVLPYFHRWMQSLPDFAALAAAPEERVLKLWEGLGYYSRARNLRGLAQALVARPAPPRTPEAWRDLPGVGPYTAAAITSISFGAPAAVVDGNVVRVLARLTDERRLFRDNGEAVKHFTPLAVAMLNPQHPGDHNQAMMELGATVCTRQNPRCSDCPVSRFCAGRHADNPGRLPRFQPKRTVSMVVTRAFCLHRRALLLKREGDGGKRLSGLHELPTVSDLGLNPAPGSLLATKRRTITRFRITEQIHAVPPCRRLLRMIAKSSDLEWVPVLKLDRIILSGPHRRWVRELLAQTPN